MTLTNRSDRPGQRPSAPAEPGWVKHVMWWHVYPLGFVGAPIRPGSGASSAGHRLGHLERWLDHITGLGLNGLQLGPVFASASHGYDTTDYYRVDPRLGSEDDLLHLISAAHERGIRVLLDGVFNHVGRDFPAFREAERLGPSSAPAGLFRVRNSGWQPGERLDVDVFEGHDSLVALDHRSPAVEDLVVDVMGYWLDRGIDGWRLDAAYAVPPAFWARVLPRVRDRHPNAWFTGEVIHGDQAQIVAASTMDSLTQYELWQGIWHGIADRNLFELAHAIKRHNAALPTFVPSTFVGNHDVTRIATAVRDPRHLGHALAVLFTVAGTPGVYAGDEYGWRAVKEERHGGDDAIRPTFPDQPPPEQNLSPGERAALGITQALIAVRRRHPWLHRAHTDAVSVTNTAMVLRTATATDSVVTVLNLGEDPVGLPAAGASRVEAGSASISAGTVHLAGHQWAVLTA